METRHNLKAFIIYTKKLDRSRLLRAQLEVLGVQYEMVESISFWDEPEKLQGLHRGKDFYTQTIGRDLSLAEVGGSFGHQTVYQKIVQDRIAWGLIFEDDAILLDKQLPLEVLMNFKSPVHINLAQHTRTSYSLRSQSPLLSKLTMPSTWAHAYLINFDTARKYSSNYKKYGITSYPDWPYPQPTKIKFFITKTEYFGQIEPGNSPTMTKERIKLPMLNNTYALAIPISPIRLMQRLRALYSLGFDTNDILFHELFLRFLVRFSRAARKTCRTLERFRNH